MYLSRTFMIFPLEIFHFYRLQNNQALIFSLICYSKDDIYMFYKWFDFTNTVFFTLKIRKLLSQLNNNNDAIIHHSVLKL